MEDLACRNQHPVLDHTALAGKIPAEERLAELHKHLVHPERIVLCEFPGLVEVHLHKALGLTTLHEDFPGLDAVIEPALDAEVIVVLGLDLVDRAVILPGQDPVASLHGTAPDQS